MFVNPICCQCDYVNTKAIKLKRRGRTPSGLILIICKHKDKGKMMLKHQVITSVNYRKHHTHSGKLRSICCSFLCILVVISSFRVKSHALIGIQRLSQCHFGYIVIHKAAILLHYELWHVSLLATPFYPRKLFRVI